MERKKIVGWFLTVIGVDLLFLIFYQAYTAYSMLIEASCFQTPTQLSIPSPVGEVPGLGSILKILKVIADSIYFGNDCHSFKDCWERYRLVEGLGDGSNLNIGLVEISDIC